MYFISIYTIITSSRTIFLDSDNFPLISGADLELPCLRGGMYKVIASFTFITSDLDDLKGFC